jgi:transposase
LRDLTRYRTTFVRERVNLVNRVHKALESANLKLASVATDIMGVWRTRHLGSVARWRR